MPRWLLFPTLLLTHAALLSAQQSTQSVTGVVRVNDSGSPLAGAEVLIGERKTTTNALGAFRLEGFSPGQYPLTVRLIGYRPLHGRVPVLAGQPTELELRLARMPVRLPTLETEAQRPGIYGSVADSSLQALGGVRVAVLGFMGGEELTDSAGGFAFPKASAGTYMIQVTKPGYGSRRISVEVPKGKGRELNFRLVPSPRELIFPGEAEALYELQRRLAFNFRNTRMTRDEMDRFGSARMCDVPKLRIRAGDPTTVILNGVTVLREASLCAWRIDEVELVEFCDLGGCPNPDAPRPLLYPGADRARRWAVVIWEKR